MRHATVVELAAEQGLRLPEALTTEWPPELSAADERGWFRFQRLYDVARSVLRTEEHVRRLVLEAAEDDAAEGSRWLEIQVDPSGYAARFGGITAFTDLVIDAARDAGEQTGIEVALVIAANRTRHPLDARTLARLAVQYAGRGVVGFGLSNDERRGDALSFARAFELAGRGGSAVDPPRRRALRRRRACGPASTCSAPGGSAMACARSRTRSWLPGSPVKASRSRCARCRTSGSGSTPTRRPSRCAALRRGRAAGARRGRPAALRVAAGRAVPGRPGAPRLHGRRAGGAGPDVGAWLHGARTTYRLGCSPTSTPGWRSRRIRPTDRDRPCGSPVVEQRPTAVRVG